MDGAAAPLLGDQGAEGRFVHDQFRARVLAQEFPCLGARAAVRQGAYRFHLQDVLGTRESAQELARNLAVFLNERRSWKTDFTTFVTVYRSPVPTSELEFERLLWAQLSFLHELDLSCGWDPRVSEDPRDPRFAFSFGGEAFFVVGLHAGSSRLARRFPWPALCFNPHDQFEALRDKGGFARMRTLVRGRDRALQGSPNPMLRDYGEASEAAQYSGRESGPEWRCPFPAQP